MKAIFREVGKISFGAALGPAVEILFAVGTVVRLASEISDLINEKREVEQ